MRQIPVKRIIMAALLACAVSVSTLYAETTQEDIDNAKEQIDNLQEQRDEAENAANDIADQKEQLESDLSSLNGQLSSIINSMNDLEIQIDDKEAEIAQAESDLADAQAALADAQAQSAKQYEDMKLRIQFMYENSDYSVWQTLLSSESITDFLNRTEYVAEINQYDRELLAEYERLQADIEAQKEDIEARRDELEEDMAELVAMKEDMETKQASVNSLIASTQNNIAQTEQDLAAAWSDVAELEDKLAQMIAYEEQLELQKAQEDAARLEAIRQQEQEDTSGIIYVPEDSDLYLLGAIIQCEAEGEPYEGKIAVGSVVMNRVKSSYFPNSISGVIYQSGQFSPVASGRLAYRLEAGVNQTCLNAAQEVLNGNITVSCLYFRVNNGIIQGTVIGNHVFY